MIFIIIIGLNNEMKSGNSQSKHFEKLIFKRKYLSLVVHSFFWSTDVFWCSMWWMSKNRENCVLFILGGKKKPTYSNAAIKTDYKNILKNNKSRVLYIFLKRKYSLFYKFCEDFHSCDTVYKPLHQIFCLFYETLTRERWVLHDFSKNLGRCYWRMIENTVCYWKDMACSLSMWPGEIYADKCERNLLAKSVCRKVFQHYFGEKLIFLRIVCSTGSLIQFSCEFFRYTFLWTSPIHKPFLLNCWRNVF